MYNTPHLVERITPILASTIGMANLMRMQKPYPFAHEDFALYAELMPAALVWLGTANPERGIHSLLHTPDYDIDERALSLGLQAMAPVVWQLAEESDGP
jgi:amidohydrolase